MQNEENGFDDMQALVRYGHGALPESRYLVCEVRDAAAAGRWLTRVRVCTARATSPRPSHALQIAFSADGLRALGLPARLIDQFADEFVVGMSGDESRSRRLGDVGDNDPRGWQWGGPGQAPVHALLLLYAREGGIQACCDEVLNAGFELGFSVRRVLPTSLLDDREPFGFVDGISQPTIDWAQVQRTDTHARERYSNLVAPGEIVLGRANEYGQMTRRPLLDPVEDGAAKGLPRALDVPAKADFGAGGSFLVVRSIQQDAHGFRQFVEREGGEDAQGREALAAAMIGRGRDGAPLVRPDESDISGVARADAVNHFTYTSDPSGYRCPLGAHVRRVNPRTGDFPPGVEGRLSRLVTALGFGRAGEPVDAIASTRFHRLLRRGRAYGPAYGRAHRSGPTSERPVPEEHGAPRGLQFMCLCANISRQFEFVQNAWCISSAFAGTRGQSDPLLGTRRPRLDASTTATFERPDERGAARHTDALPRFTQVRGGGYFFLPGIAALRYIAAVASEERGSTA